MEIESSNVNAANTYSLDLIRLSFKECANASIPKNFPLEGHALVYHHRFTILHAKEGGNNCGEESVIPVSVIKIDDHLAIPAPKKAIDVASPPAKRTALNRLRAKRVKRYMAEIYTLDDQFIADAELSAHVSRNPIDIACNIGPFLIRRHSGALDLEFGLALIPNQSVKSKRQNTALRVLARAAEDKSLIDPKQYTASPIELLQAITRKPTDTPPEISIPHLKTHLFAYQKESVEWCLKREGKYLISDHIIGDLDENVRDKVINPPLGWRKLVQSNMWINPYMLATSENRPMGTGEPQLQSDAHGKPYYRGKGLLAEEMGLGKTLEIISLMVLNQRPSYDHATKFHDSNNVEIIRTKATLIIVPQSILLQWNDEVFMHAPHLRRTVVSRDTSIEDIINSDIVFISYSELSKWLPVAITKNRNINKIKHLSEDLIYRSALSRIQFWRVVLDEVQMQSTGASGAAHAARNIRRIHAWAVSGTPVKRKLDDLRGIIYFLDLKPFVEQPAWTRLISSSIDFQQTMSIVGLRHTKPMVSHQMVIPPQHRNLVMLKLSAVERARYNTIYNKFKSDSVNPSCNLSTWLIRLRQAYFTTFTGNQDSANSSGFPSDVVALTLDEVLAQLVDQADNEVWSDTRDLLTARLELGQLLDKGDRMPEALELWHSVRLDILQNIEDCRSKVKRLEAQESELKSTLREIEQKKEVVFHEASCGYNISGDESSSIQQIRGKIYFTAHYLKSCSSKLSTLKELLHRTCFFIATGYFRSSQRLRLNHSEKDLDSDYFKEQFDFNSLEETKYYDIAESIRNDILADLELTVEKLIAKANTSKLSFIRIHEFCSLPATKCFDELSELCVDISETLLRMMSAPLMEKQVAQSTAGIQLEDDYYSKTLDLQENLFTHLEILQTLLRDRASAINGGFRSQTAPAINTEDETAKDLIQKRYMIVEKLSQYLRNELPVFTMVRLSSGGMNTAEKLRAEIQSSQQKYALFVDLYNARVEYYKQLQYLSDQVADIETGEAEMLDNAIRNKKLKVLGIDRKLRETKKNQTYLRNLEGSNHAAMQLKDGTKKNDMVDNCIVCFDPIQKEAFAPCGHSFCEDCLISWLDRHNSCPLCKRPVVAKDIRRVLRQTKKEQVNEIKFDEHQNDENVRDYVLDLYNPISNQLYNTIHGLSIVRPCGVKIDMIIRTVIYLREQDPSAQVIIFSQWLTLLKLLYNDFKDNGVKVASASKLTKTKHYGVNEFRECSDIACLLLHAKTDVAGLTLVNANHVLLCEPLMNTALELQAVSRINRIGQTRETHIWQFCVEDTVEHSILRETTRERVLQALSEGSSECADSSTLAKGASDTKVNSSSGAEVVTDTALLKRVLF